MLSLLDIILTETAVEVHLSLADEGHRGVELAALVGQAVAVVGARCAGGGHLGEGGGEITQF